MSNMAGETAAQGSPRGVTSSDASSFRHRQAVRRNAVGQINSWKAKLREVSAYSTVGPEFAWEAARRQRPIRHRLKMACSRIPRSFHKACNLPLSPRLLTTSYSFNVCFKFSHDAWKASSRYAAHLSPFVLTRPLASPLALAAGWCVSLLFEASETKCPAREISTQNHRPHTAMSFDPTIAWKASPTCKPPPI